MVTQICDIPERQNSDYNINLLAAASSVYSRAKSLMALQFVLTVPAALASSVIMAVQPTTKVWLTFFSVTVALTDALFLSRMQTRLRKRGATICHGGSSTADHRLTPKTFSLRPNHDFGSRKFALGSWTGTRQPLGLSPCTLPAWLASGRASPGTSCNVTACAAL